MKNMMLRAKNFSTFVLCTLLLLAAGCKKNDSNSDEPATLGANVARPTWTATENYDYPSSMTAVVKIDLAAQYPASAKDFALHDDDLLAAFSSDGECLGVTSCQDGLFFLYVAGTEGAVTLRYYSAYYKNIFEAADAFTFRTDAMTGTVANPFVPVFKVAE